MRIPVFLLAGVAAFAAAAQSFYTEPTANQVTRLIGAVKESGGEQGAYTAAVSRTSRSLYGNSRPTYSQVEALIRAVRESGASGGASAETNAAAIAALETGVRTNAALIAELSGDVKTNVVHKGDELASPLVIRKDSKTALTIRTTGIERYTQAGSASSKLNWSFPDSTGKLATVDDISAATDVVAGKQDSLPYPTNAIPQDAVAGLGASIAAIEADVQTNAASITALENATAGKVDVGASPLVAGSGAAASEAAVHSVALGDMAEVFSEKSVALGYKAQVASGKSGAVQLGAGVNSTSYSLQFRGTPVVGADGKIPASSLDTRFATTGEVAEAIAAIPAPDLTTNNQDLVALVTELVPRNSPVTGVNGKTGEVAIAAADIGAYDRSETDRKFDTYKPTTMWAADSLYVHNATGELFKCDIVNSKWTTGTTVYSFRDATGDPDTQTLRYNWGDAWRYIEYNPYTGLVRQNAADIYGNHWSTWGYQAAGLDPTVAGTVLTNMVGADQYGNHQQWHFTAKTETPGGTPYDRFATTGEVATAIAAIPTPDFTTNNTALVGLVADLMPTNAPVMSVNGKTGVVEIVAADVGAYTKAETDAAIAGGGTTADQDGNWMVPYGKVGGVQMYRKATGMPGAGNTLSVGSVNYVLSADGFAPAPVTPAFELPLSGIELVGSTNFKPSPASYSLGEFVQVYALQVLPDGGLQFGSWKHGDSYVYSCPSALDSADIGNYDMTARFIGGAGYKGSVVSWDGNYIFHAFGQNRVYRSGLATPYLISSSTGSVVTVSSSVYPMEMAFNEDGTRFFYKTDRSGTIYVRDLTNAWDVASYEGQASVNLGSVLDSGYSSWLAYTFSRSGTWALFAATANSKGYLLRVRMTTPWDLATATAVETAELFDSAGFIYGVAVNEDTRTLFVYRSENIDNSVAGKFYSYRMEGAVVPSPFATERYTDQAVSGAVAPLAGTNWVKQVVSGAVGGALSGEMYDFPEDSDLAKAVADIVRVLGGSVTNSAAAAEEVE